MSCKYLPSVKRVSFAPLPCTLDLHRTPRVFPLLSTADAKSGQSGGNQRLFSRQKLQAFPASFLFTAQRDAEIYDPCVFSLNRR